jgi:LPS-assembly protein
MFRFLTHIVITGFFLSYLSASWAEMSDANQNLLCTYPKLFEPARWETEKGQKQFEAQSLEHPNERLFTLTGNASVIQDEKNITADLIRYHQDTQQAYAFGNVKLQDPEYLSTAETAEHDAKEERTQLTTLSYQLRQNNAWGSAERAVVEHDKEALELKNLTYTGCPIGKEDWWLSLDDLKVDDVEKTATGHNVLLKLRDVPVFYMPWFKFSTADRASGLLMPTIASYYNENSTTNTVKSVIKIPYYFNIAPNLDDTLTLIQMADRGQVFDNEFRYWYPKQRGELTTSFLRDETSNSDRYRIWWQANQQLPSQWQLNWNWHDVSDPAFYREIQLTDYNQRNMIYLPRTATLNKDWENESVSLKLLDFKQLMYGQPYYSALPRISYNWQQAASSSPFYSSFFAEATHFAMPQAQQIAPVGNRVHLAPTVGFDIWRPYGFLRGKTQLFMTQYDLIDNGQNNLSRVLPLASLDAGLTFEKPFHLFDSGLIHTIEPRLKYLFVPKSEQNQFPVFDTMLRNFDYLQLFADNRFTGLDRIGDANQITTGLFSRLLHDDGREFFEFGLGQISYFQSRTVQLPGTTEQMGDFSDLIATASIIQAPWRLSLTQQLDRETKTVVQEDTSIQYIGDNENRLVVRHRLRAKGTPLEDEQMTLGGKVRYSGTLSSMHFINYNNTANQLRGSVNAVQYDSCCWASQLIWEHNLYINNIQDDIIRLAFIFKGLTTFGSTAGDKVDSRLYFE